MTLTRTELVLLLFVIVVISVALGVVIGYGIESQIWLAHCSTVFGTRLCTSP